MIFKSLLSFCVVVFGLQILWTIEGKVPKTPSKSDTPAATPRPMAECQKTYDLASEPLKTVKLTPSMQKCRWDILGTTDCTPEIMCHGMNLRVTEECEAEYLKITDGVGGEKTFCGKGVQSWKRPLKASNGGRDLYISFKGPVKGIKCEVKCGHGSANTIATAKERKKDNSCVCGVHNTNQDDRIVGGENAGKNEFPWQVAIVLTGTSNPHCGGSLINDRFILTAAHCTWFSQVQPQDIEVLLHAYVLDLTLMPDWKDVELGQKGSIRGHGWDHKNTTDASEGRIRLKIQNIINHPLFTESNDYDVSLLQLEKKLDLQDLGTMAPICLPVIGDHNKYIGKQATVSGWGRSDENAGSSTRILQKLDLPILETAACGTMLHFDLTDRMLCAGHKEGGRDACMGDSGGPLVTKKNEKQMFQVGIVSWGKGCARKDSPGIYTRVTDINQWVQHHSLEAGAVWCRESS